MHTYRVPGEKEMICPKCSAENAKGSRFCNNCGTKFVNSLADNTVVWSIFYRPRGSNDPFRRATTSETSLDDQKKAYAKKREIEAYLASYEMGLITDEGVYVLTWEKLNRYVSGFLKPNIGSRYIKLTNSETFAP